MTLEVRLSPEAEKRLRERAAALGMDVEAYASKLVEDDLTKPTLDEIMAPVHDHVREAGLTDEEVMELGRRELDELREERLRPKRDR